MAGIGLPLLRHTGVQSTFVLPFISANLPKTVIHIIVIDLCLHVLENN